MKKKDDAPKATNHQSKASKRKYNFRRRVWLLVPHRLAPAEIGLSISSVYIKNQTDESMSSIIAVGTATPRGEDYPCRGNVYLFKIEKQDIPNAELGQPRVKWGGSLVSTKDFRGAPGGGGVLVVSCLDGYLLAGIGIKVLLF